MNTVLLIVHLFVTLLLIGVVLIQRSEGGGLGIGGSQGMGSFMSGRGTANLLTRTTAILGVIFFALSMTLAALNKGGGVSTSILDTVPTSKPAPTTTGANPAAPPVPGAASAPARSAPSGAAAPATTAPNGTTAPAAPSGPSAPTN
ncbi:MAG TPA: preprotein translocase subunit SecG [Rhodopila sp.]|nr:preprotein translocase subunit SecG [Rhodopila sp.]